MAGAMAGYRKQEHCDLNPLLFDSPLAVSERERLERIACVRSDLDTLLKKWSMPSADNPRPVK